MVLLWNQLNENSEKPSARILAGFCHCTGLSFNGGNNDHYLFAALNNISNLMLKSIFVNYVLELAMTLLLHLIGFMEKCQSMKHLFNKCIACGTLLYIIHHFSYVCR